LVVARNLRNWHTRYNGYTKEMDNMSSLLGMELAREIHRDRLAEAEVRRTARLVRTPLFARLGGRARSLPEMPVMHVGRARAVAPSAPMGCTA
jgi:hypothetical protein